MFISWKSRILVFTQVSIERSCYVLNTRIWVIFERHIWALHIKVKKFLNFPGNLGVRSPIQHLIWGRTAWRWLPNHHHYPSSVTHPMNSHAWCCLTVIMTAPRLLLHTLVWLLLPHIKVNNQRCSLLKTVKSAFACNNPLFIWGINYSIQYWNSKYI